MNSRLSIVSTLLLLASGSFVTAATRTWTGAVNINWYDPGNWSPPGVPASADTLTVNGGSPNLSPPFTLTGQLNWSDSACSGSLTIGAGGTLNMAGGGIYGPLTNQGRINLNGPVLVYNNGTSGFGEVWNQPGGEIYIHGDFRMETSGWEFATLHNAGLIEKDAGSGTAEILPHLENSGTGIVRSRSGTVTLIGASELAGGIFEAFAGANVYFSAGPRVHSISGTADWRGPGVVAITDGNVTLSNAAGTILMLGGSIVGVNSLVGTLNMAGGGIYGPLTNQGRINLNGPVLVYNNGTSGFGEVWNQPGGEIYIHGDFRMETSGWEFATLHNAGLIEKDAGSGTAEILPHVHNTGRVRARTGILLFQAGFANAASGVLAVSLAGAELGGGYSQIRFRMPLALNGTFAVSTNGYRPNPGDSFQVLTYPSATGDFACLSSLDLGDGIMLVPQHEMTNLTLLAVPYVNALQPELFITRTPGGVRIAWPVGFPDWQLQSTTSLVPADWLPVATPCGNQVLIPATLPQQYFRLRSP